MKGPTERSGRCAAGSHTPDPHPPEHGALRRGPNSLVDQSLHSRLGAEPTNGDGFGFGWYGAQPTPGVFHSEGYRLPIRHQLPGR
jgi:predicted glutamine amidotransferase